MDSNLDHDVNDLRPLAAHEMDSVAGGLIFNEFAAAVGRLAKALADAIGDLGKPSFPITFDAGAVLKAGPAIGKLGKK